MAKSAKQKNSYQPYEELMDAHGITYTYVAQVALADIVRDPDAQARERLFADEARHYAIQMKEGLVFPPLVIWDQNEDGATNGYLLLDGNTRKAAKERNGATHTDAYVVTGLVDKNQAVYLSGALNQLGGMRMSKVELTKSVLGGKAGNNPHTDAWIAKQLGVSSNEVGRIVAVQAFNDRAKQLGLPQDLSQGHKVALAKVVDDSVLMDLVKLHSEAHLPASEIKKLAVKTAGMKSEAARLKVVADERTALAPVIAQVSQGHSATAPPSRDSLMAFGRLYTLLQKFPHVDDWVPMREESRTEWLPKLLTVGEFIVELCEAYEAAGVAPTLLTAQP